MFRLKLVPDNTKIPFIKWRIICLSLSVIMGVGSMVLFGVHGLNYGIDFRGGTMMEVKTSGPADIAKMRSEMAKLNLGDFSIQGFGAPDDVLIRVEKQTEGGPTEQQVVEMVRDQLTKNVDPNIDFRNSETVSPQVSDELKRQGFLAVSLSIVAVLIYIWFRFEWQFGVGAVAALVHDVTMTIGFFSITGLEFNLSVIAAILTIVGYSLNDTVVIFDRIRENLRRYKRMPLKELLDLSVNETLSRTVVTALTTLIALIALVTLGGPVIRAFAAAMIFGVVIGTYSSVYIASPVLLWLNVRSDPQANAEGETGTAKA